MTCSHESSRRLSKRPGVAARGACTVLCAFGLMLTLAAPTAAEIRVVTTSPTYADIVRQIGGENVKVASIMRGPENAHNVKAKPSYMMKLKKADLFFHSGLDAEAWAPLLTRGARNRNLLAGQPGNVDLSRGVQLKQIPAKGGLSRALGDIHLYGNTHYALDPLNGIIIARTITDALKRTDPKHADAFDQNYAVYAKRLRELTDRLVKKMAPYRGTRVVTYHRTWPYFLERFGLVKVAEVEPKPGISPGPRHLSQCVETMKAEGAKIVIVETYNSFKNAEAVAGRAGGRAIVLAQNVKALSGVDTYEKLFEHNVEALLAVFEAVGVEPRAVDGAAARPETAEQISP